MFGKKQRLQSPSNPPRWYTSITELPLTKYMDALVDGNLGALIISGYPSQEQLQSAWAEIQADASDLAANLEVKYYLTCFREIHALETQLTQIEQTIEYLRTWSNSPIPNELLHPHWSKLETLLFEKLVFTPDNKEAYQRQLRACYNMSRSIKIDIDLKNMQYKEFADRMQSKGEAVKPTREFFYSILITISDNVAHYHLTADQLTVYEFYERIRRANELSNKLAKQKKHGRV